MKASTTPDLFTQTDFTELVPNQDFTARIKFLQDAGVRIYAMKWYEGGWELKYRSQPYRVWAHAPKLLLPEQAGSIYGF